MTMTGLTATGVAWWLEAGKFSLAVVAAFLIPGLVFTGQIKTASRLAKVTLALVVGAVFWSWQEYLFGFLGLRQLSYLYLAGFSAFWFGKSKISLLNFKRKGRFRLAFRGKMSAWLLALLVTAGTLGQAVPYAFNGYLNADGDYLFQNGNPEDNFWHAALTSQFVEDFPAAAPSFKDLPMRNYHYWSNLLTGSFVRVFNLPLFPTQFVFFPTLVALGLGLTALSLAKILLLGKVSTFFWLFLNYFGGDFIYLFLAAAGRADIFQMSSLEDGARFLHNPPRAFSLVIALTGLALLAHWRKKKETSAGILAMLVLGTTVGFKVYTAIFLAPGLGLLLLAAFIKKRWKEVGIYGLFFACAAIVYLPANSQAGGLVFAPFMIVNNFIVQPGLGLIRWEMARQIFFEDKKYFHNLIFEAGFTAVFLVGILGGRILAVLQSPRAAVKKLGVEISLILAAGIATSLCLGLFFVQTTGGGNTFNFLVSVYLFGAVFLATAVDFWQKKLPARLFALTIVAVAVLTVPRWFYEISQSGTQIKTGKGFIVSQEEQKLYETAEKNTRQGSIVALDPDHSMSEVSPYVSIFIDREIMVSGRGLLRHFRLPVEKKIEDQSLIFSSPSERVLVKTLLENKVEAIILYANHALSATESARFATPVLKNSAGSVLKIDRAAIGERYWSFFSDSATR